VRAQIRVLSLLCASEPDAALGNAWPACGLRSCFRRCCGRGPKLPRPADVATAATPSAAGQHRGPQLPRMLCDAALELSLLDRGSTPPSSLSRTTGLRPSSTAPDGTTISRWFAFLLTSCMREREREEVLKTSGCGEQPAPGTSASASAPGRC
jgi:hypothetical protein